MFPEFPELTEEQREQLRRHHDLLLQWNRKINLVSERGETELIERHYYESLFLGRHLPAGPLRIADLGSGAGFPGFVVAVQRPEFSMTLIESHRRKAVFLREAAREISNVSVRAQRAEEVNERFDWVISRAVRYQDICKTLLSLAPKAALLTGDTDIDELPGYEWAEPIRLPWGDNRYLFVSRETSI